MNNFISCWLICSAIVFGIVLYNPASEDYLKDIHSPINRTIIEKNKKVTTLQKLIIIALGPIALGLVIPLIMEKQEENRYRLEEQLNKVLKRIDKDPLPKPRTEYSI